MLAIELRYYVYLLLLWYTLNDGIKRRVHLQKVASLDM
jgi:hypothetical protein